MGIESREQILSSVSSVKLKYLKKQYPIEYERALELGVSNKETYIMGELGAQKVYRSGNTKWEWKPNR